MFFFLNIQTQFCHLLSCRFKNLNVFRLYCIVETARWTFFIVIPTITLWVLVANTLTFGKVNSVHVFDESILVSCQSADLQRLEFLLVANKDAKLIITKLCSSASLLLA